MDIRLKRVYEAAADDDGYRVLVDRLWPRGVRKDEARLDEWARGLAPTDGLRRDFCHDPARWDGFVAHYHAELAGQGDSVAALLARARAGRVTILYGARDREHNNAVALRLYLESLDAAS